MHINLIEFLPLGPMLRARDSGERLDEEIYRTIPALNELARAALTASNRLPQDARNALFFPDDRAPELRELAIEVAMVRRDTMSEASPDLDWLAGVKPVPREKFQNKALYEDFWLSPD